MNIEGNLRKILAVLEKKRYVSTGKFSDLNHVFKIGVSIINAEQKTNQLHKVSKVISAHLLCFLVNYLQGAP
jgi:hypothetical protein